MAKGNRNRSQPTDILIAECNYCTKEFKGKEEFVNRMLEKHLILSHKFSKEEAKKEINDYFSIEVNYNQRRNYQNPNLFDRPLVDSVDLLNAIIEDMKQ